MRRILALDLARTLGWAVGTPGGVECFGRHELPQTAPWALGEYGMAARVLFRRMLLEIAPDLVVYEAPILRSGKIVEGRGGRQRVATVDTPQKLRKIYGLPFELEIECERASICVREAVINSVRSHFLVGQKVPRKSAECKVAVKVMARRRGWAVEDDNEADALAVLDYEMAMQWPRAATVQRIALGGSATMSSRGASVFVGSRQFFPQAIPKTEPESSDAGGAGPSNASSTAPNTPLETTEAGARSAPLMTSTSCAKRHPATWR